MVYQHPLAYLLGLEGLALLQASAGDHDYGQEFVVASLAEVRVLLDDPLLTAHPGVFVESDAHVADLGAVFVEAARVLRPGGHLIVSDVHHELVLLGSVVKATGTAGQAQIASTHRHTTADLLTAALPAGLRVLGYDERPRPAEPDGSLPEATRDPGAWRDWPWTLLGRVPAATRATWNIPSVAVWHLRRDPDRRPAAQ